MFKHLDTISSNAAELLKDLTPVSEKNISTIKSKHPGCPTEYLLFIKERGGGGLEKGEMFFFEDQLVDAETELFYDKEIYNLGAKGAVKIFGSECSGINYGFDIGNKWSLVQVNPDRTVTKLNLSFKRFIEGMFVCYPDFPVSYSNEKWTVATGEEFSLTKQGKPDAAIK